MKWLLVFLSLLWLGACDNGPPRSASLNIGSWDKIKSLDPHRAGNDAERAIAAALYPGLVQLDGAGQIVPAVAESWTISADGRVYLFRLRNAGWSDGKPVTAQDAVFSFRRSLQQAARVQPQKNMLAPIENAALILARKRSANALGIKALTDTVVEIQLDHPDPAMLQRLASSQAAIVPAHVAAKASFFERDTLVSANGFSVSRDDKGLILKRSNAADGQFAAIHFLHQADPAEALAAFSDGRLDVLDVSTLPPGLVEAMPSAARSQLRYEPGWQVKALIANGKNGPLADVRVRRALALATDRALLLKAAFPDLQYQRTESLLPSGMAGYGNAGTPPWALWSRDQRQLESVRLLQEAGFGESKRLTLRLLVDDGDMDKRLLQALQDQWAGLPIALLPVPAADGKERQRKTVSGSYDAVAITYGSDVESPEDILRLFGCAGPALAPRMVCNSEADALVQQALTTADPKERLAQLHRAEQLLLDDVPVISLFMPARRTLVSDRLNGWTDNAAGAHPPHLLGTKP